MLKVVFNLYFVLVYVINSKYTLNKLCSCLIREFFFFQNYVHKQVNLLIRPKTSYLDQNKVYFPIVFFLSDGNLT